MTSALVAFFFLYAPPPPEIYTLSLHDALPISLRRARRSSSRSRRCSRPSSRSWSWDNERDRSEEHTSELQSRQYLVCRLLLEKKNKATAVPDRPASGVHLH